MGRGAVIGLILLLTLSYVSGLCAAGLLTATPADAVVLGSLSSLDHFTVRVVGRDHCSGVVIARRAVATASHCARYGARVLTGSGSMRVVGASRSVRLDDGRRAYTSGDAVILRLAAPLPPGMSAAPIGRGDGDSFIIAGYGTTHESAGGAFGALHEARLVRAKGRALVDPDRSGGLGASACFGDSGGPVLRGGALVGIITRASYPGKRIACGYYTRWAPITVSGRARDAVASDDRGAQVSARHRSRVHRRQARRSRKHEAETQFNFFGPTDAAN
jgi:hypothetical protein